MSPQPPNFNNPALRKDIGVLPAITISGVFSFSLQSFCLFFFVLCWRERSSTPKWKLISWPWKLVGWTPLVVGLHLYENKEGLKGTEKNLKELNYQNGHVWDIIKKTIENQFRTENLKSPFQFFLVLIILFKYVSSKTILIAIVFFLFFLFSTF